MKRSLTIGLLAVGALLALALISCGGGDGEESGTVIQIKADDYKFLPNEVSIPAGQTVTIKLKNVTKQAHDLEVQRLQVEMMGGHEAAQGHAGAMPGTLALHTEKGKTVSATFKADRPGTYEFWCTISGHKEQGMVGKLVVTSGASGTLSNPVPRSDAPSSTSPLNTTIPSVPVIILGDGGHEGH
ncbi:MAG TPA: cupredoxin domain-containing protein [Dehalococcoidia bacterium]|nr:cupredoxin domain-containing protein [Dehalococcoidia bacterium]